MRNDAVRDRKGIVQQQRGLSESRLGVQAQPGGMPDHHLESLLVCRWRSFVRDVMRNDAVRDRKGTSLACGLWPTERMTKNRRSRYRSTAATTI
jgi:hypothetical protein